MRCEGRKPGSGSKRGPGEIGKFGGDGRGFDENEEVERDPTGLREKRDLESRARVEGMGDGRGSGEKPENQGEKTEEKAEKAYGREEGRGSEEM